MWGPGIAALICWKRFNNSEHELSRHRLFSGGTWRNVLFYMAPMLMFVSLFHHQMSQQQTLLLLMLFSPVAFFNTCGEELGWRGFLQPNLKHMSTFRRFLLLAVMWELWHLPMRFGAIYHGADPIKVVMLSFGTLILTFVIGFYLQKTKSLTTAIGLHVSVNAVIEWPVMFGISTSSMTPYVMLLIFYVMVYVFWDRLK